MSRGGQSGRMAYAAACRSPARTGSRSGPAAEPQSGRGVKVPALAEHRAQGEGTFQVGLGLHALREHGGARAFGVGHDRGHDPGRALFGVSWIKERSSLITSGATNGSVANEAGSARRLSRAMPQPRSRAARTVRISSAGWVNRARSVSSSMTRKRRQAGRPSRAGRLGLSGEARQRSGPGSRLRSRTSAS